MAPRLTDYQKKRIIASYVETGTYRAAARACQVSVNTVRKLVQADRDMLKKAEQTCRRAAWAVTIDSCILVRHTAYPHGDAHETRAFFTL